MNYTYISILSDPEHLEDWFSRAKLVSFAFRNGLLQSDFYHDDDLFAFAEERFGLEDFAFRRALAEQTARLQKTGEDPGLSDIYRDLGISAETETTLTARSFAPYAHVRKFYDHAVRMKRPVVIVEDSVLPAALMKEMLRSRGFDHIDHIYVSNEDRKLKRNYDLYRHMLSERGVKPEEVLHIGSDMHGDLNLPVNLGMRALLLLSAGETLKERVPLYPRIEPVLSEAHDGNASLVARAIERTLVGIVGQIGEKVKDIDQAALGACIGGPIILAFIRWLNERLTALDARNCLLIGEPASAFARIAEIMLTAGGQKPTLRHYGETVSPEQGMELRGLDESRSVIIDTDFKGAGTGRLVARDPRLATRPALLFGLDADGRRSNYDMCFLYKYGLPERHAKAAAAAPKLFDVCFRAPLDGNGDFALGVFSFLKTMIEIERKYTKVRIGREILVPLLEKSV